ncbi:Cullin family-domain-containing protein [Mycena olivaceomarginata]|nr:Cullin family-domain-containing protein [Mycena olivaceomarginata]
MPGQTQNAVIAAVYPHRTHARHVAVSPSNGLCFSPTLVPAPAPASRILSSPSSQLIFSGGGAGRAQTPARARRRRAAGTAPVRPGACDARSTFALVLEVCSAGPRAPQNTLVREDGEEGEEAECRGVRGAEGGRGRAEGLNKGERTEGLAGGGGGVERSEEVDEGINDGSGDVERCSTGADAKEVGGEVGERSEGLCRRSEREWTSILHKGERQGERGLQRPKDRIHVAALERMKQRPSPSLRPGPLHEEKEVWLERSRKESDRGTRIREAAAHADGRNPKARTGMKEPLPHGIRRESSRSPTPMNSRAWPLHLVSSGPKEQQCPDMRRATANTVGRYGGRLESEARAWCMRERKGRSHRAPEAAEREATSQAGGGVRVVRVEFRSGGTRNPDACIDTCTLSIFHLPSHTHTHNPGNNQLIIFGGMSNEPNSPNELCVLNNICVFDITNQHWLPPSRPPPTTSCLLLQTTGSTTCACTTSEVHVKAAGLGAVSTLICWSVALFCFTDQLNPKFTVTDKLNESKGDKGSQLPNLEADFFPPLASYVPPLQPPITSAILRMVTAQRDGAQIDQALVKKVVDSFVSLSLDAADPNKECLDIYKEQFEAPFLAAIAAAFLNAGGTEGSRNIPEYLKKAGGGCARRRRGWCGICMRRRGKSWWGSQSPPLIIPGTFLVLILHLALLDFDADEDLQRMYALLACIPEGLEPLGKKFEAHIKATGLGAVSTLVGAQGAAGATTDADAKSTELDRRRTSTCCWQCTRRTQRCTEFQGQGGLAAALDRACREFVRLFVGTSAAQSLGLLEKHADMLLRKINKVTGDVDLEGALNRGVEDCKHIDNPMRFRLYMEACRWWSAEEEEALKVRLKADMMQVFKRVEVLPQHELGKLFTDVYAGEGPLNIHFGSPKYHFPTISSTLATQIPQAAGVAYALHWTSKRRSRSIAACFFGEGAASERDFHACLLLASAIPSPTLFIMRNNGFAISTPSTEPVLQRQHRQSRAGLWH